VVEASEKYADPSMESLEVEVMVPTLSAPANVLVAVVDVAI
jgi:hypothetical protein